jgi:hypothetical protein
MTASWDITKNTVIESAKRAAFNMRKDRKLQEGIKQIGIGLGQKGLFRRSNIKIDVGRNKNDR